MGITDLSSFTSKQGVTTAVWRYDEAETFVVQHDFMHLSFFQDDFKEFVDTLVVALRIIEKAESPIRHIHPVVVREGDLNTSGREEFCLEGNDVTDRPSELPPAPVLMEVGD